MLLTICAMLYAPCSLRAALTVSNAAATNVQPTSVFFCGNLTATNGTTNAISLRLCYGTADGLTNLTWWGYTNRLLSAVSTGAFSTNVTGLTPTTRYYYRWYATQGTNTAWSTPSTSFWTTARNPNPTGAPPSAAAYPVMVDTNGDLVAPTNFFPKNAIATSAQISNLQSQVTSNAAAISVVPYTPVSDLTYSSDGTSVTITGYTGTNPIIRLPEAISGVPVLEIGASAFFGDGLITSFRADSIKIVRHSAFYTATAVQTIYLPAVTSLEYYAFATVSSLRAVYFSGPPPACTDDIEMGSASVTNYYLAGYGWGSTLGTYYPCAQWGPNLVAQASFSDHASATGTNVHGLGSAATSNATAFATAAQGTKADSA
jgi:hypothetical protein